MKQETRCPIFAPVGNGHPGPQHFNFEGSEVPTAYLQTHKRPKTQKGPLDTHIICGNFKKLFRQETPNSVLEGAFAVKQNFDT